VLGRIVLGIVPCTTPSVPQGASTPGLVPCTSPTCVRATTLACVLLPSALDTQHCLEPSSTSFCSSLCHDVPGQDSATAQGDRIMSSPVMTAKAESSSVSAPAQTSQRFSTPSVDPSLEQIRPHTRLQAGVCKPKVYTHGTVRYGCLAVVDEPQNLEDGLGDKNWNMLCMWSMMF
jgi:hypothetical protein